MFCLYSSVSHWIRWELITVVHQCNSDSESECVDFWQLYQLSDTYDTLLKCHCTSKHFSECCSNCKWHDHAAHCSVCNNDVLIVISNDENNNVNENECCSVKTITLMLSERQLSSMLTFRYIQLFFLLSVLV
jgi:hypothetical protein